MSDNDKTLSEKIIEASEALQEWNNVVAPYANTVQSLVEEYGDVIDGIGTVFAVVGVVWDIYSKMEKAKADAAEQKAIVEKITKASASQLTPNSGVQHTNNPVNSGRNDRTRNG